MSALIKLRQARLAREQQQLQQQHSESHAAVGSTAATNHPDEAGPDEESGDEVVAKATNAFSAIEDTDENQDESDNDNEANEDEDEEQTSVHVSKSSNTKSHNSKKSKIRKRRGKKERPIVPNPASESIDDIDEVLSSLTLSSSTSNVEDVIHHEISSNWDIVSTDARYFDSVAETRSRFGGSAGSSSRRRIRPTAAVSSTINRRTRIVRPLPDWPHVVDRGILSMVYAGNNVYSFVPGADAPRIQREYADIVSTNDVQNLIYFAQHHPYHPTCALSMADICESQGEFATAHSFIQRALLLFELSLHRSFDLNSGNCRLDLERPDNRTFLTLIARHAQMTGKKGCPRTALELCKLALSMSPVIDPQCTLTFIDFYAIRSGQYQWIIDLCSKLDFAITEHSNPHPWKNVSTFNKVNLNQPTTQPMLTLRPPCIMYPNLCYARALAMWHLEEKNENKPPIYEDLLEPPTLPFQSSLTQTTEEVVNKQTIATSSSYLQEAICMFPETIAPLLKLGGREREIEKEEWSIVIKKLSTLYDQSLQSSGHLDKLILVFSERSASLWKKDTIIAWILKNAQSVVQGIENGRVRVNAFTNYRKAFFPPSSPAPQPLRLLQRTQFTDTVPHLPPELLMAQNAHAEQPDFNNEGIPLTLQARLQTMAENGQLPLDLNGNALAVFLRSLLPWAVVDPSQAVRQGQQQQPPPDDILQEIDDQNALDFVFDHEGQEEDLGEFR